MKGSGCYNCPVKGCTAAYRGSRCAHLRELAGIDNDPMTNADRIRAMTDEELARQLVINVDGLAECRLHLSAPTGKMFVLEREAERVTLDWLRQPAEEE